MIVIDGSEGEGGGQVVRNACALSLVTGRPFRIVNVRGGREKPGLMRQHVTAVEAACRVGAALSEGLSVGSSAITFTPGTVVPGEYHFSVGTAGSTGLVLQTVLMPLCLAAGPSRLVLEGGTHNMLAPPFDFIERSFLPIVNQMGPRITARLVRHGFFPRGGGRIEVEIEPAPLRQIDATVRGPLVARRGTALIAALPAGIADRAIGAARRSLADWPAEAFAVRELPEEQGPGTILMLEAEYEYVTEIVSGFGKLGVSAERLAHTAAHRMRGYEQSDAFAGPYLADQLLLPMALAGGGCLTTVKPSQHSRTAADIITLFLDRRIVFDQQPAGEHRVRIV